MQTPESMTLSHDYEAPLRAPLARVLPEWIDYNGHMNVAFYVLAFDKALDTVFDRFDFGVDYVRRTNCSYFTLDIAISYAQEVTEGDPLAITFQLLDFDEKRLHYAMEMRHAEQGFLAAACEQLGVHVDLGTRRSAPMPGEIVQRLERVREAHRSLPCPAQVGRTIGIRRREATGTAAS